MSGVWPLGAGHATIGSALLALSDDTADEKLDARVIHCPVCQHDERPVWRLDALAVCATCTAVLTVTAAGSGTVAQPTDLAALTPGAWAAMVRAKSAVVAARPRPRRRQW